MFSFFIWNKNNTKQRYKTIQGLRSFKYTLPKDIKKIIIKKRPHIIYSKTEILLEMICLKCFPKSFKILIN